MSIRLDPTDPSPGHFFVFQAVMRHRAILSVVVFYRYNKFIHSFRFMNHLCSRFLQLCVSP